MEEQDRQTLIALYLGKSEEALYDAETSFTNHRFSNSANRLYYALFYAVSALFVKDGIAIGTHAGAKAKFGEHYIKTGIFPAEQGRIFSQMATLREKSDYNCFYQVTEEEMAEKLPKVKVLIEEIVGKIEK